MARPWHHTANPIAREHIEALREYLDTHPEIFVADRVFNRFKGGVCEIKNRHVATFVDESRADSMRSFRYAGADHATQAAPAVIQHMMEVVAERMGLRRFDSVHINRYTDGAGLGAHRDKEPIHNNNLIVSLSLGNSANICFRPRNGGEAVTLTLADGDMLEMLAGCQEDYTHEVRPRKCRGFRYNLTFRILA